MGGRWSWGFRSSIWSWRSTAGTTAIRSCFARSGSWSRSTCCRRSLPDVHPIQGGAEPTRQFQRVVIGPVVHEQEPRALGQHVTVQGRDRDAVAAEGTDHRVDLAPDQDTVLTWCRVPRYVGTSLAGTPVRRGASLHTSGADARWAVAVPDALHPPVRLRRVV